MLSMKALLRKPAKTKSPKESTSELRAAIHDLRKRLGKPVKAPKWASTRIESGSAGMPILFVSDLQWGEFVDSAQMDGINSFDEAEAKARYARCVEAFISISKTHIRSRKYPGAYYLRGGDMVSGEIHDELVQTNALNSIQAVKSLVAMELRGIKRMVAAFGKLHIISVPGNHGRMTQEKYSKNYAERNFDTLSAWWLEAIVREDAYLSKRVTFYTPESGDALFTLHGRNYVLTHGDRIGTKSGNVASIEAGMKRVTDYYSALGVSVEKVFVGHFHRVYELEYGFVNGCLPGMTEYGRDLRCRPRPPMQWMFVSHPKYGFTVRWPIVLAPTPVLSSK